MIALRDSLSSDFVEEVRSIFSKNGLLSKAKNFEYRPQQQEMAVAVAEALEEERHLVVEAGTGVGKSIAYLAPAILFALAKKKKLRPLPIETRAGDKANDALQDLNAGRVAGRVVLDFESLPG